ncbi:MAG: SDR family NAD(P)-dependent oxidoreductase [Deltaproteobacteria bacterium]|nr:SDR family NAD(P)-dependent oxidoreductase [Deltaproteobacteria bacterium]
MKLTGNSILVTGGGTGIGRVMAAGFLERGNRVAICGRREEMLQEARQAHPTLETYVCDVSDAEARQLLHDRLARDGFVPNVIINNAAVMRTYDLADSQALDLDQIEHDLRINFLAPVALNTLFLPLLQRQANAVIMNVSSPGGLVPIANVPIYCAAKAALHSYCESLRAQLAGSVEVIEMVPPSVETAMMDQVDIHKISAAEFADELFRRLAKGGDEIWVGEGRYIKWIHRVAPGVAFRLANHSTRMQPGNALSTVAGAGEVDREI